MSFQISDLIESLEGLKESHFLGDFHLERGVVNVNKDKPGIAGEFVEYRPDGTITITATLHKKE